MPQKTTRLTVLPVWRAAALFGAAASLLGCEVPSQLAGLHAPAADRNSPIYKDVIYASEHPGPYPQFSQIPQIPTDVRPVSAWAAAVTDIHQEKVRLDTSIAALPPPVTDTESFAATARGEAKAPAVEAPPADASDQTQSYAQSLRQRATPPPKRH